tara:strand:- start:164 stop:433 length:270 start_codon:yes stop_codon:yes gene_type:complete
MSLGISRCFKDTAGGVILGGQNTSVLVNGLPAAVLTDSVAGHGKNKHAGPEMITASGSVFCSGMPVCRMTDVASCGHSATGSENVSAGG